MPSYRGAERLGIYYGRQRIGSRFIQSSLTGNLTITGNTTVASTLTANAVGVQSDAKLKYQWYRKAYCQTPIKFSIEFNGTIPTGAISDAFVLSEGPGRKINIKINNGFENDRLYATLFVEHQNVDTRDFSGLECSLHIPDTIPAGVSCYVKIEPERTRFPSANEINIVYAYIGINAIENEVQPTYKLTEADLNAEILCCIRDSSGKYKGNIFSVATPSIRSLLKGTATISGVAKVGSTLTVIPNIEQSDAKLGYQWYWYRSLGGFIYEITGATHQTFIITSDLYRREIFCRITDLSGKYGGAIDSNRTNTVVS